MYLPCSFLMSNKKIKTNKKMPENDAETPQALTEQQEPAQPLTVEFMKTMMETMSSINDSLNRNNTVQSCENMMDPDGIVDTDHVEKDPWEMLESVDDLETNATNIELAELAQVVLPEPDLGPPIKSVKIAEIFGSIVTNIPNNEQDTRLKTYKVPSNCELLGVPRVNPEIWNNPAFENQLKSSDAKLQLTQLALSRALVCMAKTADFLYETETKIEPVVRQTVVRSLVDAAASLGNAMRGINNQRKNQMKVAFTAESKALCSTQNKVTKFLFGDDLEKELKLGKSSSKILKGPTPSPRYKPYYRSNTRGSYSGSLNGRAPFRGRGGNRRPYRRTNQFQPPQK